LTIDTSGKWWVGSTPDDLDEYLHAYSSEGYKTSAFRLAKCKCGSIEFELQADDDEGVAKRVCTACHTSHYVCDSEEFWKEASPQKWKCVCKSSANVGVGFSLYDDDQSAIRWLYVGTRCSKCGVLGCFAGWKVAQSNALHLLAAV
jgi:hypothetical protein